MDIIYMFLKFKISKTRAFQPITMVNPTETGGALYKTLIRIQIFGTNLTLFGHDCRERGREDGEGKKVKQKLS